VQGDGGRALEAVANEDLNGCWWRATGAYFEATPRDKGVLGRLGVRNDLLWTMMATFGGPGGGDASVGWMVQALMLGVDGSLGMFCYFACILLFRAVEVV
jgi:hypothetical protein